jgi:tRNA_anti-like
MNKNTINLTVALAIILSFGTACQMFQTAKDKQPETNAASSNVSTPTVSTKDDKESKDAKSSTVDKADFTVTAEELDKEFTREGVKDSDLQKYANKTIVVTGRVSTLVKEKKGTVQPWVTLYAPGILHGVSCYFDDANVDQMEKLTMDKTAKVQGFQNDFIVPKVSPRLDHCVVLEGN